MDGLNSKMEGNRENKRATEIRLREKNKEKWTDIGACRRSTIQVISLEKKEEIARTEKVLRNNGENFPTCGKECE